MVGTNPCCMQLKIGVTIITHLSMAIAVAISFSGIRLLSISSEVTTNPAFHQLYSTSQLFPDQNEILLKSNTNTKGTFRGLIYPEQDYDSNGLSPPFFLNPRTVSTMPADFLRQYAKVLLICGLITICCGIFQFLTSCILLCFINNEGKAASQIWVAVNCSVLFCLATCLVLFLCEGTSVPVFSVDEKLYLLLLTIDTLLSIYFLCVVMAFI